MTDPAGTVVTDTGPLDWRIGIVDANGRPTPEFQRRWNTQRNNNGLITSISLGSGAPTTTPTQDGMEYVDISTTPYRLYFSKNSTWNIVSAGGPNWVLAQRSIITAEPVPTFRPTTTNTQLALDLMPNGTPSVSGSTAITWADVCDADVLTNTSTPVNYLHLAARNDALEVGSRSLYGGSQKPLYFNYQGTDWMSIGSTGVTIGTLTSPISPLTVSQNASAPRAWTGGGTPQVHLLGADTTATRLLFDCFASVPILDFRRADGTNASPTALSNNEVVFQIEANGYNGSAYKNIAGSILIETTENWSTSANGTSFDVFATTQGSTSLSRSMSVIGTSTVIGNRTAPAATSLTATDGFLYLPTTNGQPTGTPRSFAPLTAVVYDNTNHKPWFYDTASAAWVSPSGGGGGGGGATYVPPSVGSFTWYNQPTSATATTIGSSQGIQMYCPANGGAFNFAFLGATAPTAPYTQWARISTGGNTSSNYWFGGLAVGDSSGKMVTWGIENNGNVMQWLMNSPTSRNANTIDGAVIQNLNPLLYGINDDGTNINFLVSYDGVSSFKVASIGRTSFLSSPSRLGFCLNGYSQLAYMNIVHWATTLPGPL